MRHRLAAAVLAVLVSLTVGAVTGTEPSDVETPTPGEDSGTTVTGTDEGVIRIVGFGSSIADQIAHAFSDLVFHETGGRAEHVASPQRVTGATFGEHANALGQQWEDLHRRLLFDQRIDIAIVYAGFTPFNECRFLLADTHARACVERGRSWRLDPLALLLGELLAESGTPTLWIGPFSTALNDNVDWIPNSELQRQRWAFNSLRDHIHELAAVHGHRVWDPTVVFGDTFDAWQHTADGWVQMFSLVDGLHLCPAGATAVVVNALDVLVGDVDWDVDAWASFYASSDNDWENRHTFGCDLEVRDERPAYDDEPFPFDTILY